MRTSSTHSSEFDLIHSLLPFQNLSSDVDQGIGDDAAVIGTGRERQLFTTDMLIEGRHFTQEAPMRAIGHKALACNISDIAAMGGVPTFAVVSLGVPSWMSDQDVKALYSGMNALARQFDVSIVGGDTVRSDKLVINVALLGKVAKDQLVLRSGAKPGHQIFVSGRLGGSLKSGRHLRFTPRVKEARYLAENFKPSAMMDISDGLAGDFRHMLKSSQVGAILEEGKIPRHRGVALDSALSDGEDFELLFTLPSAKARELLECDQTFQFRQIGRVVPQEQGLTIQGSDGKCRPLTLKGFTHF